MTKARYQVTAIDYTEAMLNEAKKNAGEYAQYIDFQRMNAQCLKFPDNVFDIVISRNLTWNLEEPEQAYSEWMCVLKPNGKLLNFDANWYHHLFNEEKRKAYETEQKQIELLHLEDHYTCTKKDQLPIRQLVNPINLNFTKTYSAVYGINAMCLALLIATVRAL